LKAKIINKASDSYKDLNLKIPSSLFENRSLSMLETIVLFLKKKGLKNKEIASFLNRDPKTISSVICRIRNKLPNTNFKPNE